MTRLWENVKDAKRREGVVTKEPGRSLPKSILAELQNSPQGLPAKVEDAVEGPTIQTDEERKERTIKDLEAKLRKLAKQRDIEKKALDVILWRDRLIKLASERARRLDTCGWDQRLLFDEEDWEEFGEDVLPSYEVDSSAETEGMEVDEERPEEVWWCRGNKKCDRHNG